MNNTLVVITVLIKFGVAAAVASALARSRTFQRLLFAERRRMRETAGLLAFFVVPLTLGVWVRTRVQNFFAADISFETVILLGLLLGPGWAMLGGLVLSIPAMLHHEFLAAPFNITVGLAAGILGRFVDRDDVWSFTPFIDLSLYRWVRRNVRKPGFDRQILML
ncbi:MAG TPA: LytS/YhcK type 5TM receptor domain-containing protein, partial [Terracidiphilus sp.]|nr:LytS/YhcK type 5TM receptor domain-containing protein [Terracidiphilus sp.]